MTENTGNNLVVWSGYISQEISPRNLPGADEDHFTYC